MSSQEQHAPGRVKELQEFHPSSRKYGSHVQLEAQWNTEADFLEWRSRAEQPGRLSPTEMLARKKRSEPQRSIA